MTTPRPKAAPMIVQIVAGERPKSLTLPGRGAASWEEALAPCKLPELTETQLEEMRKAERHLLYLQNSVPKTALNYEILLGAFSTALWGLFEKHPMGFRYALDDFIWRSRQWLRVLKKQSDSGAA